MATTGPETLQSIRGCEVKADPWNRSESRPFWSRYQLHPAQASRQPATNIASTKTGVAFLNRVVARFVSKQRARFERWEWVSVRLSELRSNGTEAGELWWGVESLEREAVHSASCRCDRVSL